MPLNTWVYISARSDASHNWTGDISGVGTSTIGPNTVNAAPLATNIGDRGDQFIGWNGNLADAAIWEGRITDQEVYALQKGARPWQIKSQKLVGWWPLDGYGHPALDRSFKRNHGVLSGTAFVTGPPLLNPAPIILPLPDPSFVMPAMIPPPPPPFILMPQIVM
jgi:hypothetical protein